MYLLNQYINRLSSLLKTTELNNVQKNIKSCALYHNLFKYCFSTSHLKVSHRTCGKHWCKESHAWLCLDPCYLQTKCLIEFPMEVMKNLCLTSINVISEYQASKQINLFGRSTLMWMNKLLFKLLKFKVCDMSVINRCH